MKITRARTDTERAECNHFFHKYLNVGPKAVGTLLDDQVRCAQGFDAPGIVLVTAHRGPTLIGAVLLQTMMAAFAQIESAYGSTRAQQFSRSWRLLSHMAVHPAHQRHGIGTLLIERAEQIAIRSGARGVFGFAEDSLEPSWPFYQNVGYTIEKTGAGLPLLDGIEIKSNTNRPGRDFHKTLVLVKKRSRTR